MPRLELHRTKDVGKPNPPPAAKVAEMLEPVAATVRSLYGLVSVVESVRHGVPDGSEMDVMVEAQPPSTAARPTAAPRRIAAPAKVEK